MLALGTPLIRGRRNNMGGQFGTKETEDCLYLAKVVAINVLREVKRDGFQPMDLGAFLKSAEFEKAIHQAMENVDKVSSEVAELDFFDGLSLGRYVYLMASDILGELRALSKRELK